MLEAATASTRAFCMNGFEASDDETPIGLATEDGGWEGTGCGLLNVLGLALVLDGVTNADFGGATEAGVEGCLTNIGIPVLAAVLGAVAAEAFCKNGYLCTYESVERGAGATFPAAGVEKILSAF